jgi:hypothetical protein
MPDSKEDSTSSPQDSSNQDRPDATTIERLEKEADEMARAAQRVERRYDQDHDIFTK